LDIQYINNVTGMSVGERDDLIMYFKGLPESVKIIVFFDQRITIKKNGALFLKDKRGEFDYSTFILTIQRIRNIEVGPSKKSKLDKGEMDILYFIKKERIKDNPRRKRKRKVLKTDKILKFKSMILQQREEGMSWENISDFLREYYGFKISRDYLYKLFR